MQLSSKRVKTVLDDNRKLFKIPFASLNTDIDVLGRLLSIYCVLLKVPIVLFYY